jgi:hypothetical protein
MNISTPKSSARWLLLVGLIGISVFGAFEILAFFSGPQNWARLSSPAGLLTVAIYLLQFALGLVVLILGWFIPDALRKASRSFEGLGRLRWVGIAVGLLAVAWFYLYSPWEEIWPGPWTQFIFAMGLASCFAWLARPERSAWGDGKELTLAFGLFLYPRIILELRAWYRLPIVYRGATLVGYLAVLGLVFWLFTWRGQAATHNLIGKRDGQAWLRWPFAAIFLCGPLIYLAVAGADFYAVNPAIRFSLLLMEVYGLAFLIGRDNTRPLALKAMVVSALALALVSFVANALLLVVDYPFSLSWSEGNRFYDYSLQFGQNLYDHVGTITNPYGQPGRYILWGGLFLWHGLPIQVHRFWNVVLITVLPLIVGWLAARKISASLLRAGLVVFVALLFTVEAPLHPPFLLAAALALVVVYDSSLVRRGIILAVASFYVGTSRWTWIPVTAAWGILADLILYYPLRQGSLLKRIGPTLVLAALGLVPGLISGYSGLPLTLGAREYHQPLLWYRLLPNPTFPLGVLLSTILISGPALCIVMWLVYSRRWILDWIQQLAVGGALLGFLGAGLIVSTKIGGGADLHNLDMYLMTLAFVVALGIYTLSQAGKIDFLAWPVGIQVLLGFMLLFPLYEFTPFSAVAALSPRLDLAKPQEVKQALVDIQTEAARAGRDGAILFMDQRQLLTFGYIHDVRFVPEYEKKYMMDMAMASNSQYFQGYYQDLAHQRFRLIITEILRTRQERGADFSEENNAWVKWVSEPTLCFYEPSMINKDLNVELLVPKEYPLGCEAYLRGE